LDALIFDFDGVVVDSEPIHLLCFQQVMKTVGVELTREAYYREYLGYDDHDCIVAAARNGGIQLDEKGVGCLIDAKTELVQRMFRDSIEALPGAVELICAAADADIPLAICSGALREEIEMAIGSIGVAGKFRLIVDARDVSHGKPDPEGYITALRRLRECAGRDIDERRSVVVEDSPAGIASARGAGMKVLAVTNSYPAGELSAADKIVESLVGVTLDSLDELSENCAR